MDLTNATITQDLVRDPADLSHNSRMIIPKSKSSSKCSLASDLIGQSDEICPFKQSPEVTQPVEWRYSSDLRSIRNNEVLTDQKFAMPCQAIADEMTGIEGSLFHPLELGPSDLTLSLNQPICYFANDLPTSNALSNATDEPWNPLTIFNASETIPAAIFPYPCSATQDAPLYVDYGIGPTTSLYPPSSLLVSNESTTTSPNSTSIINTPSIAVSAQSPLLPGSPGGSDYLSAFSRDRFFLNDFNSPHLIQDETSIMGDHRDTRTSKKSGKLSRARSNSNGKIKRIYCSICGDTNGFRGQHEFERHFANKHGSGPVYVCADISPNKDFLSGCKSCRNGRVYNIDYNAAAHLRRQHFKVKKPRKKNSRPLEATVKNMLDSWGITDWRAEEGQTEEFDLKFCRKWMVTQYTAKNDIDEAEAAKSVEETSEINESIEEEAPVDIDSAAEFSFLECDFPWDYFRPGAQSSEIL